MPHALIGGRRIEYRRICSTGSHRPELVFLHEGLGSMALWRDFPDKVAQRLDVPALIYSRFGYGQSDGLLAPRTPRFMHEEALEVLPKLLDELDVPCPLLIGHSDGASIALIHAAGAGRPVAGLVLIAPHIFVEDVCIASIAGMRERYRTGDLRSRLARHHTHVDDAFLGWADTWLLPEFRAWSIEELLHRIDVPVLVVQGEDDEYGTLAQLDRIAGRIKGPLERLVVANAGHAPQRDREADVLGAIVAFATGLRPD